MNSTLPVVCFELSHSNPIHIHIHTKTHDSRIILPLTVKEHREGQLYTVAKQSIDESDGSTAVEIQVNEPFEYPEECSVADTSCSSDSTVSECEEDSGSDESDSETTSDHTSTQSMSNSSSITLSSSTSSSHHSYLKTHKLPATRLSKQAIQHGQYTQKVYHVGGHLPGWMRALAPPSMLKAKERAWNCYPYCRTVMSNEYFGDERFHIVVETLHVDLDDSGSVSREVRLPSGNTLNIEDPENVFQLSEPELKKRQVYHLDICKPIDGQKHDPTVCKSLKAKRGPWQSGFTDAPRMIVYKLVTIRTAIFGLQSRVEKHILEVPCLVLVSSIVLTPLLCTQN